ncbi:MAG: HD domain-containing protein [Lachnospiraceae bacterium]|nr:HD domain-containing protein [Lachnospiraceae bacterium]
MIQVEVVAFFLLFFDRIAYMHDADPSRAGFFLVRVSNLCVFFLTPYVVLGFDIFLMDWLLNEGRMKTVPKRLRAVAIMAVCGMIMAVISGFTGLYYYFDETNRYHRGQLFLVSYIIPVLCPLIVASVVIQYRKIFSRRIYAALLVYIFLPLAGGIIQLFVYGIPIVNMSIVIVSVLVYILVYLDINDRVVHAYEIEIRNMQGEHDKLQRVFDQTATAFVSAVEKKDEHVRGCSARVAEYAEKIAGSSGMDEQECRQVYYAALLHNVGLIGVPESLVTGDKDPAEQEKEVIRMMPEIGSEILSSIQEMPYLETGARYCHENYNGTGGPEGLKGGEIPEIARIISVADAYVYMTTDTRFHEAVPDFIAREALVKGSGEQFDPRFADLMIKIIDGENQKSGGQKTLEIETGFSCNDYREHISRGIPVDGIVTKVSFDCAPFNAGPSDFSDPALILFDSYDGRVHENEKSIENYGYLEYGEIWFNEHDVNTSARKIQNSIKVKDADPSDDNRPKKYEMTMGRFEDHIKLKMVSPGFEKEVIIALPDRSRASYIALTGEHCRITEITVEKTKKEVSQNDIQRIAAGTSYIERMESDLKNVQIDRSRSVSTTGVRIKNRLKIIFHAMSLPSANLVWHCPFVILFSSDDGCVNGSGYKEYACIKLCGENDGDTEFATNSISVKKTDEFSGWDRWKEMNKKGLECEVSLRRKDDRIILKTKNLGIEIESITAIRDVRGDVYAALSGDQVALTDIRVI